MSTPVLNICLQWISERFFLHLYRFHWYRSVPDYRSRTLDHNLMALCYCKFSTIRQQVLLLIDAICTKRPALNPFCYYSSANCSIFPLFTRRFSSSPDFVTLIPLYFLQSTHSLFYMWRSDIFLLTLKIFIKYCDWYNWFYVFKSIFKNYHRKFFVISIRYCVVGFLARILFYLLLIRNITAKPLSLLLMPKIFQAVLALELPYICIFLCKAFFTFSGYLFHSVPFIFHFPMFLGFGRCSF